MSAAGQARAAVKEPADRRQLLFTPHDLVRANSHLPSYILLRTSPIT
jgi:hypothetical protein